MAPTTGSVIVIFVIIFATAVLSFFLSIGFIVLYVRWSNDRPPTLMDLIIEASGVQRRAEQNDPELLSRRAELIEAGAAPRANTNADPERGHTPQVDAIPDLETGAAPQTNANEDTEVDTNGDTDAIVNTDANASADGSSSPHRFETAVSL